MQSNLQHTHLWPNQKYSLQLPGLKSINTFLRVVYIWFFSGVFFMSFIVSLLVYNSYFAHKWYVFDFTNICLFFFLLFCQNPRKYYKDLATFLEMPCTDHFIEEIIEKCSFKNLKDNKLNCSAVLDRNKKQTLFRKGLSWKSFENKKTLIVI